MKQQKYTWKDALKEVLKEFIVAVLVLGLCCVALVVGVFFPKELLSSLSFEISKGVQVSALYVGILSSISEQFGPPAYQSPKPRQLQSIERRTGSSQSRSVPVFGQSFFALERANLYVL